jgi:hypothetical protein
MTILCFTLHPPGSGTRRSLAMTIAGIRATLGHGLGTGAWPAASVPFLYSLRTNNWDRAISIAGPSRPCSSYGVALRPGEQPAARRAGVNRANPCIAGKNLAWSQWDSIAVPLAVRRRVRLFRWAGRGAAAGGAQHRLAPNMSGLAGPATRCLRRPPFARMFRPLHRVAERHRRGGVCRQPSER